MQSENASQQKDLAALTDRYDSDSAASAGEIAVLRADLLETQTQNASQQAELTDLTARYDGLRAKSTATIDDLQDKSRLLQAKINAQEARLESLSAESSGYQNALLAATQAIAELRAELAKTREAAAQAKAALEQDADGLKKRLAAALAQKLADDAEQEDVRAKLAAALAAKLAAERLNADQMTEAETRAALLSEAQKTLSKEKAISAKARREMALLNQQVAALRTQLQNLQGLLDDAMAKDIAEEVQLQNLGSQLNSALARVAAEERKRRRLEEAERKRLEREALELQGRTEQLSYQAKDLEKYRSEFFGRLRDVLGQQEGVRIAGDRFVFSSEVLFPPGGADLSPEGQQEVAKVAEILKTVAGLIPEEINWVIRVDGHTDDTKVVSGSRFADNWHLSQARALSVVRYFANTLDIPPNRLAANGFGEYQPVNTENTPEARAQNRRIELKLTEK
jgi:chemotaxis protein MotB